MLYVLLKTLIVNLSKMHVAYLAKTFIVTLFKEIDKKKLVFVLSTETQMHIIISFVKTLLLLFYLKKLKRISCCLYQLKFKCMLYVLLKHLWLFYP